MGISDGCIPSTFLRIDQFSLQLATLPHRTNACIGIARSCSSARTQGIADALATSRPAKPETPHRSCRCAMQRCTRECQEISVYIYNDSTLTQKAFLQYPHLTRFKFPTSPIRIFLHSGHSMISPEFFSTYRTHRTGPFSSSSSIEICHLLNVRTLAELRRKERQEYAYCLSTSLSRQNINCDVSVAAQEIGFAPPPIRS